MLISLTQVPVEEVLQVQELPKRVKVLVKKMTKLPSAMMNLPGLSNSCPVLLQCLNQR